MRRKVRLACDVEEINGMYSCLIGCFSFFFLFFIVKCMSESASWVKEKTTEGKSSPREADSPASSGGPSFLTITGETLWSPGRSEQAGSENTQTCRYSCACWLYIFCDNNVKPTTLFRSTLTSIFRYIGERSHFSVFQNSVLLLWSKNISVINLVSDS